MTTTPETRTLMAAMYAAQGDLPEFAKEAYNEFAKFHYTSADAIIDQTRAVLRKHGVMAWVVESTHTMNQGEPASANLTLTMEVRHIESGEFVRVTRMGYAEPHKGTPLDKAIFAAETSALGYWLRGLMMAPRLDSEEVSARNDNAFNPNEIGGVWFKQWLVPTCERLGVNADWLRGRLIAAGMDRETVALKPEKWPLAWKQRIKEGLSKHPKAKDIEAVEDPDGALGDLPQAPAVDTTQVRTAPAPTPAAENGKKPKAGASKGDANAQPPLPLAK